MKDGVLNDGNVKLFAEDFPKGIGRKWTWEHETKTRQDSHIYAGDIAGKRISIALSVPIAGKLQ
jgi:hypothetical protein